MPTVFVEPGLADVRREEGKDKSMPPATLG